MTPGLKATVERELKEALERERDRIILDLYHLAETEQKPTRTEAKEGASVREPADAALERTERQRLAEVEAALARLEDGTYGQCLECGSPIGEGRLRVVPWASECWRCALRKPRPAHWDG